MTERQCIYTIPAGLSFVDELAKGILERAGADPLSLARMQVLLPTRRACRSLREAFLRLSEGRPLLLPRMNPIGDVDEEELSLTLSGRGEELSIPPALPPLRRQFLLAKLIGSIEGRSRGIEQDMALAAALARLMDQIHTEDLDLADLPHAVDTADFSEHWQISLRFLEILSKFWPLILEEEGAIDAADRRNRLLKSLAEHWKNNPPPYPVIAAGSTGSIPATAGLLNVIARLPDGCIVLPGLDQAMDEESWKAIDDTHPQATLKHLVDVTLESSREQVLLWPSCAENAKERNGMRLLVSEIMRPADTAQQWQTVKDRLDITREGIHVERYDCANPQEEALTIALALRGVLEDATKTAALVTPDRKLARRVAMACRRWGIEIDDSGGQALADTKTGTYLRLCMEAVCKEMRPVALLDFAKHSLCLPAGFDRWRESVRLFDLHIARGPAFEGGIDAYRRKLPALQERKKNTEFFSGMLDYIERGFAPLLTLATSREKKSFGDWLEAHLKTAEFFCDPSLLWAGQDGEAAASFLSGLRDQASLLPDMEGNEYLAVLELAMAGIAVRPAYGLHPRLMILGQLEARLVEADVMILSGLNEGTWPPDAGLDPWMSRPMRKRFGLPPLERSIGLSAHDFAQSLCAPKVYLTRSLRVDGTPTVPSRWLQRMDTVLQACGLGAQALMDGPLLEQARLLDHTDEYRPVERPAPRPPVDVRPRQLSVTQIDLWMNDPYSIYARHILKLKPLDPLEQPLDAAMRGTLIHAVLDDFVTAFPDRLPHDAQERFMTIARRELEALSLEQDIRNFWEPRLAKIAGWLTAHEQNWRQEMKPAAREVTGKIEFEGPAGAFVLTARADRIDLLRDGSSGAIIDYKSGGAYTVKGMQDGRYPQLPLEALILEGGGFEAVKPVPVSALSYWVVNGGKEGGTVRTMQKQADLDIAKQNAQDGMEQLISTFDSPSTPYYSLPRPEKAPRYNDYEHLARVREWTALDEQEDAA